MESKEMLFTVAGLLATFLLPWPNEEIAPQRAVPSGVVTAWDASCTAPTVPVDGLPHRNAVPVRVRPSPAWDA